MSLANLWKLALEEDKVDSDCTTNALAQYIHEKSLKLPLAKFKIITREKGVFSGQEWLKASAEISQWSLRTHLTDGEVMHPSQVVVKGEANLKTLLTIERSLLNGLQHACGVATLTRDCVEIVRTEFEKWNTADKKKYTKPGIYHTRKTLPGIRLLDLQAVESGGGFAHRRNLADRFLAKDNHKDCLTSLGLKYADWARWVSRNDLNAMFEVDNLPELSELLQSGVQHFLLDNFTPAQIQEAVSMKPKGTTFEVSGGLNQKNLAAYVLPGVDRLSLGSLTHSVRSIDLGLDGIR